MANAPKIKKVIRLGTRKSLLAVAQSQWVAREIEKKNPNIQVELHGLDTQGDRIQDVPLSKVEGKSFFTAELDRALLDGEIDMAVHSLKDLSLDRPRGIRLAAIPRRESVQDVILFRPETDEALWHGLPIRIGTSAPRRIQLLPTFLKQALPALNPSVETHLEFVEIRGNVTTRISRALEPVGSPKFVHGVVLALAGLERLWNDEEGRRALEPLLQGLRMMVLPVSEFAGAPGQGALAVECRSKDEDIYKALRALHDPVTEKSVERERTLLADWGGGCHMPLGASCVPHPDLGEVFYSQGVRPEDGRLEKEMVWESTEKMPGSVEDSAVWDGSLVRGQIYQSDWNLEGVRALENAFQSGKHGFYFIAHSRALPFHSGDFRDAVSKTRFWTSGVRSWFRLAKQGYWIEGCADGFGYEWLEKSLYSKQVLRIPPAAEQGVLTHLTAEETWEESTVYPTYMLISKVQESHRVAVGRAKYFFWTSGTQFAEFKPNLPADAIHACGPGKTKKMLERSGIKNIHIFPQVEAWRTWVKNL
jgi:hydroxymethylbilane synthase